ncbi:hypothetical protein Peur_028155 [Populus x canadensis]
MKDKKLVSSRSSSNYSSGFFKLYFDNDNALRLLYDGPGTSSIYWPDTELMSWETGAGTRRLKIDFDGNLRLHSQEMGETHGLFHGKPCLNLVGFMGLVDQTVIAAMFLILVENVLAFQDSRSRIIQTGLWVVNQRSIFLVVKIRLASFN